MKGESASTTGFWIFIAAVALFTFFLDANAMKDLFMGIFDGCFMSR